MLRTSSTPSLSCFLHVVATDKSSDQVNEGLRHEQRQPLNIEARFRKIQSESDLQTAGDSRSCTPAAAFSRYDCRTESGSTTPQKNWSRRTGLRRGSSLPASLPGSKTSELDSVLDELQSHRCLPGLQEAEERVESYEEPSASGRHQEDHPHPGLRVESFLREPVNFSWEEALPFLGIGFGSTGGRSNVGFGGGGGGSSDPDEVDAYYRRVIKEDPLNSLLLRNYARYLHEERRDHSRAEEFYERAMLAAPDDAEIRTRYAKLIWEFRGDEERAACYFEQAARASPDDCDVLGAYAAFLWDVEEEQETPLLLTPLVK